MSKPRVLVIDDEIETLTMLKAFLELFSFDVVGARTGMEGIKAMGEQVPAVLILDLMLPDLDGIEICRRLRNTSSTRDMPVIILSARSNRADVRRAYEAGATRYLKKPVDLDVLVAEVREVIESKKHKPPPDARKQMDEVKPAAGFMHSGSIQAGISVPVSGDDIDFVIGGKKTAEQAEDETKDKPAAKKDEKKDPKTVKIPNLYIRRDDDTKP